MLKNPVTVIGNGIDTHFKRRFYAGFRHIEYGYKKIYSINLNT